jgi:hypothetical protein
MTFVVDGTNGLTFPNSTTQTVAGAPLTTPSFTTTIGVGAATASASGAGITFPVAQSASSDANTLDDYEEGTWTPSTSGNNNLTSVSITDGRYTKIGKLVTISASVSASITATSTETNLNLTLPFNTYSSSWYAGGTWCGYAGTGPNRFTQGQAFNGSGSATNVVFYIAGVNVTKDSFGPDPLLPDPPPIWDTH